MTQYEHVSVMMEEVLEALKPAPGQTFVDLTLGLGGHTREILKRTAPDGRLLGIDKDPRNLDQAKDSLKEFGPRVTLVNDSYKNLAKICYDHGINSVDGILMDLGFSSAHMEDAERGFAFKHEGPLDMRYDPSQEITAEVIINDWSQEDLAKIFRQLGEERNALKIAVAIVRARRKELIETTTALSEIITDVTPGRGRHTKLHPATRVFQALRIAVNDELSALEQALPQALGTLRPGGRLAVISFHSLEDRIVKQTFKKLDGTKIKIITKRPVTPTAAEIKANPRSRSAKLRVAERMS